MFVRPFDREFYWLLAVAFCLFSPALVRGQSDETDVGEVSVFGGGSFGLGTHPVVGGNTGIAFSRHAIALIEAAFQPMGDHTVRRHDYATQDSRLFDFNASLHIRIPVRDRWAPYAILGGGLLFDQFTAVVTPTQALIATSELHFGFHTGAGLRYYIRPGWGIRPEFRVIVSNRTYTRMTVGLFYTLSTEP
jgi:hypothetical protein